MRIIFITANFEPEIAASIHLTSDLVEDLARNGCEVHVVTPMPTRGVDAETQQKYIKILKEIREDGNLIVHRIKIPFLTGRSFLSRVCRDLLLTGFLFFKALFLKGDMVFSYSTPPTLGFASVVLGKLKRIPVVYNLQDIFPDSLVNAGVLKGGATLNVCRWIEKLTYRGSDRIVVISEDFKRNILQKGVPEKKIDLVYNWIDETKVTPIPRGQNVLIKRYNLDPNAFYVTYCGNIGLTQNLELLIDVAKSLEEYPDLQFVVIGDGAHKPQLEAYAEQKKAANVKFLSFQPYEDIAHVYSLGDVGLIISKKNIGQNSFPSKTWSIMAAGRAVLASFDEESELCKIINQAHCGVYVQAEELLPLKTAVFNFYLKRDKLPLGENGRTYIMNNLTRIKGTSEFYKIFKRLCENEN